MTMSSRAGARATPAPRTSGAVMASIDRSPRVARAPASSAIVRRGDGLATILRPEINVCVWRRALAPRLLEWLAQLGRGLVHDAACDVSAARPSVSDLFAGLPDGAEARAWAADVASLATRFAGVVGAPSLRASLATVVTDKCRKLHSDYKRVRLVCTYAGPGTEWLDDRDVDRDALRRQHPSIEAANARVVRRGARVHRTGAGDVLLLKGELHAGNEGRGAIHRSPPIELTGERRLVLTLDML